MNGKNSATLISTGWVEGGGGVNEHSLSCGVYGDSGKKLLLVFAADAKS